MADTVQKLSYVNAALENFARTSGLAAQPHTDARTLLVTAHDCQQMRLPYEVKNLIDRRDQLLTFKHAHPEALLITGTLSNALAEQCRDYNLQFIDQSGNCFLRQAGLYVFIAGTKSAHASKPDADRGLTPAVLRTMFALLTNPTDLDGSVRKIAALAGVSHGAAGIALTSLETLGFIHTGRAGRRVIAMPERWLEAWTEGYLGRIRPKLKKHRMSSSLPFSNVLELIGTGVPGVAIGGDLAASVLDLGLKPGTLTLYIRPDDPGVLPQLAQTMRLRRDAEGPIELVETFWNTAALASYPTVPRALIYADLVGEGDGRSMEVALRLKKDICLDVANQT